LGGGKANVLSITTRLIQYGSISSPSQNSPSQSVSATVKTPFFFRFLTVFFQVVFQVVFAGLHGWVG
jgi:hypothetical protein